MVDVRKNALPMSQSAERRRSENFRREILVLIHRHLVSNFIDILQTNFSYERCFGSFFYVHVTSKKLPKQHLYEKFVLKMLMKLTTGVPFYQHFTSSFFFSNHSIKKYKHKLYITLIIFFKTKSIL